MLGEQELVTSTTTEKMPNAESRKLLGENIFSLGSRKNNAEVE